MIFFFSKTDPRRENEKGGPLRSGPCAHSLAHSNTHRCFDAEPSQAGLGFCVAPAGLSLTSLSSLATSLSSLRMPSSCPMTIFMRCRIRSLSPPLLGSSLGCPRSGAPRMFILHHVAASLPILAPAGHTLCLPPRSPPRPGRAPHFNGPPAYPGLGRPSPSPCSLPLDLLCLWVGDGAPRGRQSLKGVGWGGQGEDTGGQGEGP